MNVSYFAAAILSAFLDALTVTAVLIGVTIGFCRVHYTVSSGKDFSNKTSNYNDDSSLSENCSDDLEAKAFLRDLVMHGALKVYREYLHNRRGTSEFINCKSCWMGIY